MSYEDQQRELAKVDYDSRVEHVIHQSLINAEKLNIIRNAHVQDLLAGLDVPPPTVLDPALIKKPKATKARKDVKPRPESLSPVRSSSRLKNPRSHSILSVSSTDESGITATAIQNRKRSSKESAVQRSPARYASSELNPYYNRRLGEPRSIRTRTQPGPSGFITELGDHEEEEMLAGPSSG